MILNQMQWFLILISNHFIISDLWFWSEIIFFDDFTVLHDVKIKIIWSHSKYINIQTFCAAVCGIRLRKMEFLAEYKATVEPLAITLDGLEGDEHCYYGMLLPKLTQLRYRLEKLQMSTLQYCGALVNALLVGLDNTFSTVLAVGDVGCHRAGGCVSGCRTSSV